MTKKLEQKWCTSDTNAVWYIRDTDTENRGSSDGVQRKFMSMQFMNKAERERKTTQSPTCPRVNNTQKQRQWRKSKLENTNTQREE